MSEKNFEIGDEWGEGTGEITGLATVSEVNEAEKSVTIEPTNADLARQYVLDGWEEHKEGYDWTFEDFQKEVMACSDQDIILLADAIRAKRQAKQRKKVIPIHKPTNNWKQRLR